MIKKPTVEELTFAIGYKFTRVYKIVTRTRVKKIKTKHKFNTKWNFRPKIRKTPSTKIDPRR